MPRFFVLPEQIRDSVVYIEGPDAGHIGYSLRMRVGENLTVCDGAGTDYNCRLIRITGTEAEAEILDRSPSLAEPTVEITLYQCLPKGDKMESIVQKAVELGVRRIVPVLSKRCVSRPEDKALAKKRLRWQSIADEAAKQSGRGILPEVTAALSYREALAQMELPGAIFYEDAGSGGLDTLPELSQFSFLIGPEGGFEPEEVAAARDKGLLVAGLGRRILRTETAGACVLAALMYKTGNL